MEKEIEEENGRNPKINRYWIQRYDLFSRYDKGIEMDEEGWYSVTHEEIAVKQAERCRGKVVELAINNAKVYGVADRVDLSLGDVLFLSPPWGGPTYCEVESFKMDMLKPRDG
ncbi:unnamed protein product [Arabis nemorensis]|uniref:Trimethylguanosine synthase n=1 Tax=Arabis nemorensis TaxID=586526 RepID=A0A565CR44_9BRAS|nr:unnamed protein product [Arabis nemorensis]